MSSDIVERLLRDATCMEAWSSGIGPYPATVQGVSRKHAERARQAVSEIQSLRNRIAELEVELAAAGVKAKEIERG